MPYDPIAFRGFRGLNLAADQEAVNEYNRRYRILIPGAIDLLNVSFTTNGEVRQRDGYAKFTSSAAATRYRELFPFYTASGTTQLLAGRGTSLSVLNTSGGVVATNTPATATNWSFVRLGTPSAEYVYIQPSGQTPGSFAVVSAVRWDGSAFTNPGFGPGWYVGKTVTDNRLISVSYNTGGAFSPNRLTRIMFSDPGAPETFQVNNYVDLDPGDGEGVTGITTFRELTLIFKPSRFYVFYGQSTDSTGNPIFNYRGVDAGVGLSTPNGLVATPQGVFFINRRGIYLTTGSSPTLVSRAIDPVFVGGASAFFQSGVLNQAQIDKCALGWWNERLYFSYPSGSATANDRTFVWDPATDVWSLYDIPAAGLASFRVANAEDLMFSYASGTNDVGRHNTSYTTDAGSNITSRYQWGFFSPAYGAAESVIRELVLSGIGTVAVKGSHNFGSLGSATNIALGTSPNTAYGRYRVAQRGTSHSWQISSVSGGAWTLTGGNMMVRENRFPGLASE